MIRKLPAELIREIAAGEVIRAPVDVVKEIFDNAIDAGATRMELAIVNGGIDLIELKDNGKGIPREQLPLAVEAHATSKLEDIHAISTLGFRGEGLYAIRYAATLQVLSRPKKQLGGASLLSQGDEVGMSDVPAPEGTTVSVSKLFALLPARLSSLDSAQTENKKIVNLLHRYLLHHPNLSVRFTSDDKERWSYAGGSFLEAAKFFWGSVTANRLLDLEYATGQLKVEGLLSRPELARPRRDRLLLSVNGRAVEWPDKLLKSLLDVYKELLPANQFPVGIVNLTVPFGEVLVNTSPEKNAVRFLDSEGVCIFFEEAIRKLLAAHPLAKALPDFREAEAVATAPQNNFPDLEFVGSYQDLYLIAQSRDQLWVIDQHAAHERILFEELQKRYQVEEPVILVTPEIILLNPTELASLEERQVALGELGFELESFGASTYRLRSVPLLLAGHPNLIQDVLKGTLNEDDIDQAWRNVLARLACLPAIKAGHSLNAKDATALLQTLSQCETPWSCPHGRPTALVLSELELARRFGRRGSRTTLDSAFKVEK